MKIVVMANPNTFQVLEAVGCPEEFRASNGIIINGSKGREANFGLVPSAGGLVGNTVFLFHMDTELRGVSLPALAALHEMVYQHPAFSDDGQTVTMTHGKFWICERPGGQVCFQVLEMDEAFRSEVDRKEHGRVVSNISPWIDASIFLRGRNNGCDFDITVVRTTMTRTQIVSALIDWDQNWPGWKNTVPTLAECCKFGSLETGGVFVFDSEKKGGE